MLTKGYIKGFIQVLPFVVIFTQPIFSQHKVIYSTYLGAEVSSIKGVEVDNDGTMYVVGNTASKGLIVTENALEKELKGQNSTFVQAINSNGKLVYSTYLNNTYQVSLKTDSEGHIYLMGVGDYSNDSLTPTLTPTANPFQINRGGRFLMKLNVKTGKIIYSIRIGSFKTEYLINIDVDRKGNVYLAGLTQNPNFPTTPDALLKSFPKNSASHNFVAKLNPTGTTFLYSTLLGREKGFSINDLKVDSSGNAYLVGSADWSRPGENSSDFPVTPDAYQPKFEPNLNTRYTGENGFLLKLNNVGSKILYAAFLGGNYSICRFLAIDNNDRVYVAGITTPERFKTTKDAFQIKFLAKFMSLFIVKFNESLTDLEYSTFFAGDATGSGDSFLSFGRINKITQISRIIADKNGQLFIVGGSSSDDLPITKNASQKKRSGNSLSEHLTEDTLPGDAFLSVLNPTGNQIVYSTYLVSLKYSSVDVALDTEGNVYVAGGTPSQKLPITPNALQRQVTDRAGFLMKLQMP